MLPRLRFFALLSVTAAPLCVVLAEQRTGSALGQAQPDQCSDAVDAIETGQCDSLTRIDRVYLRRLMEASKELGRAGVLGYQCDHGFTQACPQWRLAMENACQDMRLALILTEETVGRHCNSRPTQNRQQQATKAYESLFGEVRDSTGWVIWGN